LCGFFYQQQRGFQLAGVVFQPLAVEGVALGQMLAQGAGGPLAKAGALDRLDPIADRDDDVEVVVLRLVGFAIGGSYPEFPDN